MVSMNTVLKDFGRPVCRRCINRQYRVHLQPQDCQYSWPYPSPCPNCKETHHIVEGLSLRGRLKLLKK